MELFKTFGNGTSEYLFKKKCKVLVRFIATLTFMPIKIFYLV